MAAEDIVRAAASNLDVAESMRRADEVTESYYGKPSMVRFPNPKPFVLPQLQVESEQSERSDFLQWQVYAFGGYIVIKWLWGKWKERQNQKGNHDN